jgi:hypothetical protein
MPDDGPTCERLAHSGGFFTQAGTSRSTRRTMMLDDALGRAWMRQKLSDEEYSALKRYALHWLAGGLLGPIHSLDLDRVFAPNPGTMTGLAKTERQQDHRDLYRAARCSIGKRPAFAADHVACYGSSLKELGIMLGYRSAAHARIAAGELLGEAGYRLGQFWKERDRGR